MQFDQITRKTLLQVVGGAAIVTGAYIFLTGGAVWLGGAAMLVMIIGQVVAWALLRGGSPDDSLSQTVGQMSAGQRIMFRGVNLVLALLWVLVLGTTTRTIDFVVGIAGLALSAGLAYASFKLRAAPAAAA